MKYCFAAILVFNLLGMSSAIAETTCFGDGTYRVCSTSSIDSAGNMHITSNDTMGNTYSLNTNSYTDPAGRDVISSSDSAGNTYNLKTWSDASGVHSVDSEGNSCTITPAGEMIGCD